MDDESNYFENFDFHFQYIKLTKKSVFSSRYFDDNTNISKKEYLNWTGTGKEDNDGIEYENDMKEGEYI